MKVISLISLIPVLLGVTSCTSTGGAPIQEEIVWFTPSGVTTNYQGPLRVSFPGYGQHANDDRFRALVNSVFVEEESSGNVVPHTVIEVNPPLGWGNTVVQKGEPAPENYSNVEAHVDVIIGKIDGWLRFGVRKSFFVGDVPSLYRTLHNGHPIVRFSQGSRPTPKELEIYEKPAGVVRGSIAFSEPIAASDTDIASKVLISSAAGPCKAHPPAFSVQTDPGSGFTTRIDPGGEFSKVEFECPAGSLAKSLWHLEILAGLNGASGSPLVLPAGSLDKWTVDIAPESLVARGQDWYSYAL